MRIVLVSREFEPVDRRVAGRPLASVVDSYLSAGLKSLADPSVGGAAFEYLFGEDKLATLVKRIAGVEPAILKEQRAGILAALREASSGIYRPGDQPLRAQDSLEGVCGIVGDLSTVIDVHPEVARMLGDQAAGAAGTRSVQVHLIDQSRARGFLRRHGGGVLEDGAYVLHPKRVGVLVPLRTYHAELLGEMQREARVLLGRLGARKLTIETVEGVTFGGQVVSRAPTAAGAVKAGGSRTDSRTVTYEWHSPTFDPDGALEGCVMVQDNTGVMTLVNQRKTSDLKRYEESSTIDTSFGVDVSIMAMFKASFEWASTSTYRYEVDFFPKS